ncbi:serine/threonine-protein kinase [Lentisphaera profundi]|uniref:Serine/threonine-protein kinase n=1 Tax=Lentisphaera profundi TaxID=1658616 RepID=A0ABY7VT50_9BACT|nr:serine/threonine-protein kinase [Lentisphaera profundi]WDE96443.1 serine/threonine-protein kinase [Lentisphaera profundi]
MAEGRVPDDFLKSFYEKSILEKPDPLQESELISSLKDIQERYLDKRALGEGGMKLIESFEDQVSGRRVAKARIKNCQSAADIDNFIREARLTAMLEHPNIVPLYDIGLGEDGFPYFTMKQLGGKNLQQILEEYRDKKGRQDFTLNRRLDIFLKICDAVAYAHSMGVVHLDIKPANIQINEYGEVLLCDWGLARDLDRKGACETLELRKEEFDLLPEVPVSIDQRIKGTPGFMAPEQIDSKSFGKRSVHTDVYSLGAVLYSLLVLEAPFAGDSVKDAIIHTLVGKLLPPMELKPDLRVPSALNAVVLKAMSPSKENRYQSADEFANEIRSWLGGFATSAEEAGFVRNMSLVFKRHKTEAFYSLVFLIVAVLIAGIAFQRVNQEKERAQQSEESEKMARQRVEDSEQKLSLTVDDLELERARKEQISLKASNNFYSTAMNSIRNEQYTRAMTMIDDILALNPLNQKALLEKGRLLIGQLRFHEAVITLKKYQKQKAILPLMDFAKKYRLIKPENGLLEIDIFLIFLNDVKEVPIKFNWHIHKMVIKWVTNNYPLEMRIELARRIISADGRHRFIVKNVDQGYTLDISDHEGLQDIAILSNLPLLELDMSKTAVRDLSALRGMQLNVLNLSDTYVSELSSLKKADLEELDLRGSHVTKINDLNLKRLKLIYLNEFIVSLSPLASALALEEIYLPKAYDNEGQLKHIPETVKIIRY